MEINYDYIANILMGYIGEGIFTADCENQIQQFAQTKDINVFSPESRRELNPIFDMIIRPAYQETFGKYIPNIFVREEE